MPKRHTAQHTYNADADWDKVNKDNKQLVKEFMEYISATDKSPDTKEKYLHNLKLFFQWVLNEKDNRFFADLKKRDFMSWLSYLNETQGLSPSRVRVLRSTVSSLSNFCENILADEDERFEDYRNLILKIPAPPLEKVREKTFLTDEQINNLLDWLEANNKWQQCLYVALSFATGARKKEILQMKKSDFTEKTLVDGLYHTSVKRAKGKGKQGKQRNFDVPADIIDKYLNLYLVTRDDDIDDLFISKRNGKIQRLNETSFNYWCKSFTEYLGVPVYPHCYRSSIATVLKNRGKDPVKIQTMLGHKDLNTTMMYIQQDTANDVKDLFS